MKIIFSESSQHLCEVDDSFGAYGESRCRLFVKEKYSYYETGDKAAPDIYCLNAVRYDG